MDEILTFYREGDRITLEGEADQVPDQEPGDIVFTIEQTKHPVFERSGADLSAELTVTLAEALCGFSRVVLKHLDGRGIHIEHPQKEDPRVLEPDQIIKVAGEGMPIKKSETKGDLYLIVKVTFPSYRWIEENGAREKLKEALPQEPGVPEIEADIVDDVTYDEQASLEEYGGADQDGGDWEDEEEAGQAQCAQQ